MNENQAKAISANELRIGNWLYSNLTEKHFQADGEDISNIVNDETVIKPIPLTPEILEKAGFVKDDMADLGIYRGIRISDEIWLSYNEPSIWIGEYDTCVKYLHQLQNLYFALTGEELNITL